MKTSYKREQCKYELENQIIEKIKVLFQELKKQTELQNDQMKYIEHGLHQADQAIKKLSEMRTIFRNLSSKINTMKKMPARKKVEYGSLIEEAFVINFSIFFKK